MGALELSKIELYGVSDPNISGQLILAKEMGFFRDEGLDVSCRLLSSGTMMPKEVMDAKEKPFAFTQTPITTLVLQDKGLDVKIVTPLADISGTQQIVVRESANIHSPQDLAGKRVGMAKGAAVYIAVQRMAREFGIDLSEVEFVDLMPAQQLEALENGSIDAMACWEPWTSKAQGFGGRFWFSGAQSKIHENEGRINWLVNQSTLMTFPENCERYPETLNAVLRAFQTATKFINENIEQAAEILSAPLSLEKEAILKIVSLNKYSMTMDGLFKIGLIEFRGLLHQNGAISTTPPENELYTTEFLRELDPNLVLIEEEEEEEEDEDLQEYLAIFFEEVDQIMRKLAEDATALEYTPTNKAKLKAIAGAFHTLKGNSGFLGFDKIHTASKQIEGYLKNVLIEEQGDVSKPIMSLIYYSIDLLNTLVADYKQSRSSSVDLSELQERIAQLSPEMEKEVEETPIDTGTLEISGYEGLKLREAKKKGKTIYQLDVQFDPEWKMKSAGAFIIVRKLNTFGEVVKTAPPLGSKELKSATDLRVLYATELDRSRVIEVATVAAVVSSTQLEVFHVPEIVIVQKDETDYFEEMESGDRQTGEKGKTRTLRVDYKKLDDIVNIIGELIIGGSTLARGLVEIQEELTELDHKPKLLEHLQKTSTEIRKNLLNLQENVMKVRMTPIDVVFRKFPRIVRDLALKSGKEVQLEVVGEGTDLDKTLIDVIDEPLFHLIKNTIDHGIEPPMVREQLGKPKKGTIQLTSFREGNQIVISIEDDGRGLDIAKMKRQAYEAGKLSAEKMQKLTKADAFNLLFTNSVEEEDLEMVGGKRSGMLIVRQTVQSLNGTVELESRVGEGTVFTIKLPLTMAIIPALVFGVGKQAFALPISTVVEAMRVTPKDISWVGDREVFELRDQVVNLIRPHKILSIPEPQEAEDKKMYVIVVHSPDHKFVGIIADYLMEKEELVIKSLDTKIMKSNITSSASKLGDGRVVLILDIPALIQQAFG